MNGMQAALDIIQENRKKHETQTDSELLDFAIAKIQDNIAHQTIQAGQEIRDAVRVLENLKNWSNLIGWSKHILGSVESILEEELEKNPSSPMKSLLKTIQFKKAILHMSTPEIMSLLTENTKQKYFSEK